MARNKSDSSPSDIRWGTMERRDRLGRVWHRSVPLCGAKFGDFTVMESELPSDDRKKRRARLQCCEGHVRIMSPKQLRKEPPLCKRCRGRETALRRVFASNELADTWSHRYTGIISRCCNPACNTYANYGGRGITICDEWREDKFAFFAYAKTLPRWAEQGLDLDRIDNELGYFPGNLRLVERKVNARNRRANTFVEFKGEKMCVAEFAERFLPNWKSINSFFHHYRQGRTTNWIVAKHDEGRKGLRSAELR